ncbi:MAG: lysophospholipid acyltransferase family protein [Nitrospirota bacterium]
MSKLFNRLMMFIVPLLGAVCLRLLKMSVDYKVLNPEQVPAPGQRVIFSFWHNRILMSPFIKRAEPATVMVSRHKDGELISRTVRHLGINSSRGSTTRGGMAALKEIIRLARQGHSIAFTPDGPRGPRYIAQPGVIQAAKATGLPILPLTYGALKKKPLNPGTAS